MSHKDQNRITEHPILQPFEGNFVEFYWDGIKLFGKENEMISSALIANGIHIFGHHPKDNSPQGIFCANGQCAQCQVLVDGVPLKSCMTPLKKGMRIESIAGFPPLPKDDKPLDNAGEIRTIKTDVLIIGGGPSGLTAAIDLAKYGAHVLLVDDKSNLGGKLVLQTHKFFGSVEDSYAGTRGNQIGEILAEQIKEQDNIEVWLNSIAIGVFVDQKIGIQKEHEYVLVKPKKLLVATGAREKMLAFPGNTLPGVYGAGAFQTLVNRDLIKSSDRIFIVGGGNVGLIAGYHALQAGMDIVGLVEALPNCGGYKVHEQKLRRLGVPIYTRHTVISAHGTDHLESVIISQIDENFKPIKGTEKQFNVDTLLIAVGLDPVDEFFHKAQKFGMDVWAAGDAKEIAEASAAMFSGKIVAVHIANSFGLTSKKVPEEWENKLAILKSRPGKTYETQTTSKEEGIFPIFHCDQEIPCNPATSICPKGAIITQNNEITGIPEFVGDETLCIGCRQCVAICPGLAISLVDYRDDQAFPTVTLPSEVTVDLEIGQKITIVDKDGNDLGNYEIQNIRLLKKYPRTKLLEVKLPKEIAQEAISYRIQKEEVTAPVELQYHECIPDEAIICRCERVKAGTIRNLIRKGLRDMNQIKAITKAGLGACGAKTCTNLIERIFREEGIRRDEFTTFTKRPLFVEMPLKYIKKMNKEE